MSIASTWGWEGWDGEDPEAQWMAVLGTPGMNGWTWSLPSPPDICSSQKLLCLRGDPGAVELAAGPGECIAVCKHHRGALVGGHTSPPPGFAGNGQQGCTSSYSCARGRGPDICLLSLFQLCRRHHVSLLQLLRAPHLRGLLAGLLWVSGQCPGAGQRDQGVLGLWRPRVATGGTAPSCAHVHPGLPGPCPHGRHIHVCICPGLHAYMNTV